MTEEEEKQLCLEAFQTIGTQMQMVIAMEELAEMAVAISHLMRGRQGAAAELAEEIADVEMVCTSMRLLVGDHVGDHDVDAIKAAKWERLRARVAQQSGG